VRRYSSTARTGCSSFAEPERNRGHEYWLVFGTRFEHSIYYREEFERIARENPNFHYLPTLSRCGDEWQGCRGYVQDHVREIVAGRRGMEAYICGLNQMVAAVRQLLTDEMGWDRKHVIFERYD
jgi:NAD(P)H-flavin reductase